MTHTLADFHATTIDGTEQGLGSYVGDVVLVVNVASQCGLTPQYTGLQRLYDTYGDRGFVVLGFPCNQFGSQEPGTEAEILTFCESSYAVTFPLFAKVDVNGDDTHPLYRWLKEERPGPDADNPDIVWNFGKFLLGRDGRVLDRFPPQAEPDTLTADIEKALAAEG